MPQQIIITDDNEIRVVQTGPVGPQGAPGPQGPPGNDGAGGAGLVSSVTGAATLTSGVLNVPIDSAANVGSARTLGAGATQAAAGDALLTEIYARAGADNVLTAGKANLVSGKVPTAELGSGTADATKVLLGNQTWATLAGGGNMLSSVYDPAGKASQVVTANERIHIKDFGAVGNGTTDDTAAFNSALTYLGGTTSGNGAGTIVLGEGTFRITSTVIIFGKAVIFEGAGVGNPSDWGIDYTTKSRGSTIVWDGVSTTTPMFTVRDSWFCQFKDILITARPSRKATSAIYFENFGVNSRGTNAKHSVVRCRIGASSWESGHLENVRFDYGVRIGGINGNNDEWMIEGCVFTNYGIAGTWVETSQSVWGHISDTLYEGLNNGPAGRNYPALMGVKVDADVQMSNVQFNRNSVNVQISAGQATIFGMYAEQFRQAVLLTGSGSRLNLYGGRLYHNIEEWETAGGGLAVIEHRQCGGGAVVNLQGVSMNANGSVTLPRKIKVRGNGSSVRGDVFIVGCSDLDLTSLDIAALGTNTGPNEGLYVNIDSFGKKVRRRLVSNSILSTTAEDNFSTYGTDPSTNRVGITGTDAKAFVSGVETAALMLTTEKAKLASVFASDEVLWHKGLASQYTAKFSEVIMSSTSGDPVKSFTKSIALDNMEQGAGTTYRLRFTSPGTGVEGGNTRTFQLYNAISSLDSEVSSQWGPRTNGYGGGPGNGQLGHVHRAVTTSGVTKAYVVWHDITFGVDPIINVGVWTNSTATDPVLTLAPTNNNAWLHGIDSTSKNHSQFLEVTRGSCTTTVVTLTSFGHTLNVGDVVNVTCPSQNKFAITGGIVTAVNLGAGTFSFDKVNAVQAIGPTEGFAQVTTRTLPYNVKSRCEGSGTNTYVMVKAWTPDTSEPNWGDSRHVHVWQDTGGHGPTTVGKMGLIAAHLYGGRYTQFGSAQFSPR